MAMKPNHTCLICGTAYYACNACTHTKEFAHWKKVACSPECYQMWSALNLYRTGDMTQEAFMELYFNNGMDQKELPETTQVAFGEILGEV